MTTLLNTEALRFQPRTDEVRGGGAPRPHDSVAQSLHFAAMLEALSGEGEAAQGAADGVTAAAAPSPVRAAPDVQRVGAPMATLIAQGGFDAPEGGEASGSAPTQPAGQAAVAFDVRWMAHLMAAEG